MGNCLGTDVKAHDAVGAVPPPSDNRLNYKDTDAKELLTGALSYCSWLHLHLACRNLRNADFLRYALTDAEVSTGSTGYRALRVFFWKLQQVGRSMHSLSSRG